MLTLEKLLEDLSPKTVCVMLEVEPGHTFDDSLKNMLNVDKLDKVLGRIESASFDPNELEFDTYLVYRRPIPEGQDKVSPPYAFHDTKVDGKKIQTADLALIMRLDWSIEIVNVNSAGGVSVPPYTILPEEPDFVWQPG
ncbi:hypothetical protein PQD71_gp228 [Kosakonia phage Kc263]|uniref:Uncharacterized protein n=1 Tax=Kosakonia phage Kc263 TaxID=2863194 RepID=A0AAE7WFU0_9CAUD|nr:hypothetical protein PQD71_gp228 [Kosakonia phage Kc263]QYN80098.1 hypothetical protein [Kosakonia phage Kc263]